MTVTNDENASCSQIISMVDIPINAEIKAEIIFPIYEFRPPTHYCHSSLYDGYPGLLRYNNGNWIEDNGEYDLAFVGYSECHAPVFWYVEIPDHIGDHHYYRKSWHPNEVAHNNACWVCAKINSCASGISIDINKCKVRGEI